MKNRESKAVNEFFDKLIAINNDPNKELDVVYAGICMESENAGFDMVDVTIDGKTVRMYVAPEED